MTALPVCIVYSLSFVAKGIRKAISNFSGCAAYAAGCAASAVGCAAYIAGCGAYAAGCAAYVHQCVNKANSVQLRWCWD